MSHIKDKLQTLVESEGFEDSFQMLEEFVIESVVPGICMNKGCDYITDSEPDCTGGWCKVCDTNSVESLMILAGVI